MFTYFDSEPQEFLSCATRCVSFRRIRNWRIAHSRKSACGGINKAVSTVTPPTDNHDQDSRTILIPQARFDSQVSDCSFVLWCDPILVVVFRLQTILPFTIINQVLPSGPQREFSHTVNCCFVFESLLKAF